MQFKSIQTSILLLVGIQCFIVDGAKRKQRHTLSTSTSSRGPIIGGYNWVDSRLPEVQHAAKLGVLLIGQVTNESRALKLLNVIKAHTQLVAGFNYHMDVSIGYTDCGCGEVVNDTIPDCCNVILTKQCNMTVFFPLFHRPPQLTEYHFHGEWILSPIDGSTSGCTCKSDKPGSRSSVFGQILQWLVRILDPPKNSAKFPTFNNYSLH